MEIMKKSHIKSKFDFVKFGTFGADRYFNDESYMINDSKQNIPIVVLQVMPVGDLVVIEYVEEKDYKETKIDVE